jgi:hypothetical protein
MKKEKTLEKYIASNGFKCDSKYELNVAEYLIRNNIEFKEGPSLKYEGQTFHIDLEVSYGAKSYLFEVKEASLLQNAVDEINAYKKNHVIVITDNGYKFPAPNGKESNGLKYLHKCAEPLIGVDIELFKKPDFPYAADRPKCFYNVIVDKKMSALDAWKDEALRFKMIINRIEMAGGFINNKSILNAFNITRTCKQPSWFSKEFAKRIIQDYISTDVIVDPFGGWGARLHATLELGKEYYGCDLNQDLVDWINNPSYVFGDATTFKYKGKKPYSVFICPPYTDFEVYIKGQNLTTTQCQWLDIVRQNNPKAAEYVMVCKVVDKGYEQYIIDEKVNKSHFGTNKEYVLRIK